MVIDKLGRQTLHSAVKRMIEKSLDMGTMAECPKCGASFTCLENSLLEGKTSPNYNIAQMIIGNCDVCRMRFKESYDI